MWSSGPSSDVATALARAAVRAGPMVWAVQLRSGSDAAQREQPDPGREAVLGAEPGVGDRHQPVAVHLGDGADAAGARRRGRPSTSTARGVDGAQRRRRPRASGRRSVEDPPEHPPAELAGRQLAAAPLALLDDRVRVEAGQQVGAAPGRRPPTARGCRSRRAARPRAGPRPAARATSTPSRAGSPRPGRSRSATRSASETSLGAAPAAAGRRGTGRRRRPRPGGRARARGGGAVEGEGRARAPARPGATLRASKGCSGWRTVTASDTRRPPAVGGARRGRRAARRAVRRAAAAARSTRWRRCR